MICEECGAELTGEMFDTGFCYNCGEKIVFRTLQDKISKQQEQREKVNRQIKRDFILTTSYNIEKYTIEKYITVISAETALGTGFLSEFSASFSDFLGIENSRFSDKLSCTKQFATDKIITKAISLGGNAIIGLDYDYINFTSNLIGVVANGTVVKILKINTNETISDEVKQD